ncbi:ankyrin repeat-containing domain protein [Trichoderma velutinum]
MGEIRYVKCVADSEETRAQYRCNDQSHQIVDQAEGTITEECDKLKESIHFNEEEKDKLKQGLKDVHTRNGCEIIELKRQIEVHERQTKEYSDREEARDREIGETIGGIKNFVRFHQENFNSLAEELTSREEARSMKFNETVGLVEELSHALQLTVEWQAKGHTDRKKAGVQAESGKKNINESLHDAVENGPVDVIKMLLSQGADIDAKSDRGSSPLFTAAWYGKVEVAQLLLNQGANIHLTNDNGNTALHHAAYTGQVQMARFLIDRGANINAKNKCDETPLTYATNGEMCRLLSQRRVFGPGRW